MENQNDINAVEAIDELVDKYNNLKTEIAKVIVGQEEVVRQAVVSILSGGHCLLIGVPGLAKTLLVNTISQTLGLQYSRIQFTPDLMPSDILGTEILDVDEGSHSQTKQFRFIKGPVFTNILLADEINRCPPKTQSALLEAMQERSVTIARKRYELPLPFFVLATQNPIEQEGTYPLPEAQLDRFMFNILLDYPVLEQELEVVKQTTSDRKVDLNVILSGEEILLYQQLIRKMPIADNVLEYAVNLAANTRPSVNNKNEMVNKYVSWGAGPRASQCLIIGAKCNAAINGKYSPDIEDVQAVANPVLRHRIIKNYRAEADGVGVEDLISELM
jgi:MoxR-like ATPase